MRARTVGLGLLVSTLTLPTLTGCSPDPAAYCEYAASYDPAQGMAEDQALPGVPELDEDVRDSLDAGSSTPETRACTLLILTRLHRYYISHFDQGYALANMADRDNPVIAHYCSFAEGCSLEMLSQQPVETAKDEPFRGDPELARELELVGVAEQALEDKLAQRLRELEQQQEPH
jgi:hypothetical protein